jgi:hypothetical protein
MSVTVREPLKSVIAAMREFVAVIDEVGRNTPPPINLPSRQPQPADEPGTSTKTSENSGPLRPSVRDDQPDTPPTQREIQAFLHRLRRTSFRRSSKGFTDWMKEMGADPGAADDPTGCDDQ